MQPPGPPAGDGPEELEARRGEEAPAEPTRPQCPRCGAPHDPLQEYCLECGQRLVPLAGPYVRHSIWSRESPIWLWLALGALLLVALAAGGIVALAATDEGDGGQAAVSPSSAATTDVTTFPGTTGGITVDSVTGPTTLTIPPPTTTLPTTTFGTTTFGTTTYGTTTFGTTTGATTTSGTTTGSSTIGSWPSGTDGFTVVLRSTPTSGGRGAAEAAAQQARNAGLPEVGILSSSSYSSLNAGYYVTYTGVYDTRSEAENALPRARSAGFPTAYVRQIAD